MAFPRWTEEHEPFRESVRRFTAEEIRPFAEQWLRVSRRVAAETSEVMREVIARRRTPAGPA